MNFVKKFNFKIDFITFSLALLLSLIITFFYSTNKPGKTKVTIILKENYSPEIYILLRKDYIFNELFESATIKYVIKNLNEKNYIKKKIFLKKINIKNINLQCKKSIIINYSEIDNRTFLVEMVYKTINLEDINLCALSTLNTINNLINDQIYKIVPEYKLYIKKYGFLFIPPEIIKNEDLLLRYEKFLNLENTIKKNPIEIDYKDEVFISKYTRIEILFTSIFFLIFISLLIIKNRKKIILKINKKNFF